MLSPGRYLEYALRRNWNRPHSEAARLMVMEFVRAGGVEEFNLDYRIETQIELAKLDLEVLPPAFAKILAPIAGFDCDTYFQLVEWFEQPGWRDPPNICRVCGAPADDSFEDGVCGKCQWVKKNKLRVVASYSKQFDRIGDPVKRIGR